MKLPASHELNVHIKVTLSLFLLCITFGMIQGQAYLIMVMSETDNNDKSVLESISEHYYVPTVPILKHAIDGSMKDEVETEDDRRVLEAWMNQGASEQFYEEKVREIIQRSCIDCHSPGGDAEFANFENFENLQKLAIFSYKPYIKKRLRMAHPHMLSIPLFILPTVLLLGLSALSDRTKMYLMGAPLLGTFVDVTGWFLTMFYPGVAIMILIGGVLCHVGTYTAILLNFYYLWLYEAKQVSNELC